MKVGDLVVDTKWNYAPGVVIELIESNLFGGADDVYRVYCQRTSKPYYAISSNLKTLKEFRNESCAT